jgi:hypothetical protein
MSKNSKRRPTLAQWEEAVEAVEIEGGPDQLVETVEALKAAVVTPPVILTVTIDRSTGRIEIATNVRQGTEGLEDMGRVIAGLKKLTENLEAQALDVEVEMRVAQRLEAEAPADSQEE